MLLQFVAFGVTTGAFLLLATLGFALVTRVEKFLNIAHAELMSVSALVTWWLSAEQQMPFLLAAIIAVCATVVVGLIVAALVYMPIIEQPPTILLITSVGVAFLMHGVIEAVFLPGIRRFPLANTVAYDLLGVMKVHQLHIVVLVMALVSFMIVHVVLVHTQMGSDMRAVADNRGLARLRGIDVRRTGYYTWTLASALAGTSGVALGLLGTITTEIAFQQILLILSVSIVAGLGRIAGLLVAAFGLGIIMDVSVLMFPAGYRSSIAFVAIILVLIFRPYGIFATQTRTK